MSKCSEVWVFGSRISAGMEAEIERAKWKNYRLRYFTENLKRLNPMYEVIEKEEFCRMALRFPPIPVT